MSEKRNCSKQSFDLAASSESWKSGRDRERCERQDSSQSERRLSPNFRRNRSTGLVTISTPGLSRILTGGAGGENASGTSTKSSSSEISSGCGFSGGWSSSSSAVGRRRRLLPMLQSPNFDKSGPDGSLRSKNLGGNFSDFSKGQKK